MGIFTMTGRTITMVLTTVPFGLLLLAGSCLSDSDFGYDEDDGPSRWGEKYPKCSGNRQSPINIDEQNVEDKKLPPLEICGYKKRHTMTVVNNGHTIMMKSNESSDELPIVTGGPLGNNTYKFEQLHFHWGKNDLEGSETTINNKSFPMEMHAVFYKEEYKSMSNALEYEDGLTVLGYMIEVERRGNKLIDSVVKVLPEVQEPDEKEAKISKFFLSELLKPESTHRHEQYHKYYTYLGSLTTPPCLEIVTWIVFQEPKYVSSDQVAAFREVKTHRGESMSHNFRSVQPLGDRVVYRNIPNGQHSGQCGKKLPFPWVALQTLLGIFLIAI